MSAHAGGRLCERQRSWHRAVATAYTDTMSIVAAGSAPATPAAARFALVEAPRSLPWSTIVALRLRGRTLACASAALCVGLLLWADGVGGSGTRVIFWPTVDVEGIVANVDTMVITDGEHRYVEHDTSVTYAWGGEPRTARAPLRTQLQRGELCTVRVPPSRLDLAIPFDGDAPRSDPDTFVGASIVGIAWLVWLVAWRDNARDLRLLREGRISDATLVGRRTRKFERKREHFLTFSYPTHRGTAETTVLVDDDGRARLSDEREPMLYDAGDIHHAVLLDALPDHVRIDGDGRLTAIPWHRAARRALPLLAVLVAGTEALRLTGWVWGG
jgi:hypothetical protein